MDISTLTLAAIAFAYASQPYYTDTESKEERCARMTVVGNGERYAVEKGKTEGVRWDALTHFSYLSSLAKLESNFAQHVHEGRCSKKECDRGWSRSIWQVKYDSYTGPWEDKWRVSKELWSTIEGVDQESTNNAAWAASMKLLGVRRSCGSHDPNVAFTGYAMGLCHGKAYEGRVKYYKYVRTQLTALSSQFEEQGITDAAALCTYLVAHDEREWRTNAEPKSDAK